MKRIIKNRLTYISLAILSLCFGSVQSKLLMLPYLQAVTEKSIVIMAETDTKEPPIAIVSDQANKHQRFQSQEFQKAQNRREITYIHRIYINNLLPNTKYSYKIIHEKDTSDTFQFQTSVTDNFPFRFAVTGDNRSNPEIHSKITKKIAEFKTNFILYTGDLCYSGKYFEWKNEFFTPEAQRVYANIPFFNALGNHEAQTNLTSVFLQAPKSNSGSEFFYSFDFGNVHFLILNTEEDVGGYSKQFKFAQIDLENSKKQWKFVAFHIPAYSAGPHKLSKAMQNMTSKIFESKGVSLVFNGHNHFYQRNFVNGIYHFVFGGGGSPLYEPKDDTFVQKSVKEYNFAIIDVNDKTVLINVYNVKGNIIDSISISKQE